MKLLSTLYTLKKIIGHEYHAYRQKFIDADPYMSLIVDKYYKKTRRALLLKQYVILMIDGKALHGGLTDRLRGCLGIYSLCKKHNIPFFINWTYPFDLRLFLKPNVYNWEINSEDIIYESPYSQPIATYISGLKFGETIIDKYFILRNILCSKHTQYHIYTNSIISESKWPDLFQELFKPSPVLEQALKIHKANLKDSYYSFTFRFQQLLGDFKEGKYATLEESEQENLIHKCLNELTSLISKIPSKKVLVTSDSITFLNRLKNNPQIYIVPGTIAHMNFQADNNTFIKSFVDFYLIMGASKVFLMKTSDMYNSGFPRFAAQIGNKPFYIHKF